MYIYVNVRIVMKYDIIFIYFVQFRSLVNLDYIFDEFDFEMEEMISVGMKKKRKGQNLDEMVVMVVKEMGKELYVDLFLVERKVKFDVMVRLDVRDFYYIDFLVFQYIYVLQYIQYIVISL